MGGGEGPVTGGNQTEGWTAPPGSGLLLGVWGEHWVADPSPPLLPAGTLPGAPQAQPKGTAGRCWPQRVSPKEGPRDVTTSRQGKASAQRGMVEGLLHRRPGLLGRLRPPRKETGPRQQVWTIQLWVSPRGQPQPHVAHPSDRFPSCIQGSQVAATKQGEPPQLGVGVGVVLPRDSLGADYPPAQPMQTRASLGDLGYSTRLTPTSLNPQASGLQLGPGLPPPGVPQARPPALGKKVTQGPVLSLRRGPRVGVGGPRACNAGGGVPRAGGLSQAGVPY